MASAGQFGRQYPVSSGQYGNSGQFGHSQAVHAPRVHVAHQGPVDDLHSAPFSNVWYPDTGANAHATPQLDGLNDIEPYTGTESLRVGDGAGLSIANTGSFFHSVFVTVTVFK